MNTDQLKQFKQQLLNRQAALLELTNVSEDAAKTVELDQSKVGRVSRMDAMQAQAMSLETNRRRALELIQIKTSLNRIMQNEYGYCIQCESSIALKRLEINPTVLLCINCAEKNEQ